MTNNEQPTEAPPEDPSAARMAAAVKEATEAASGSPFMMQLPWDAHCAQFDVLCVLLTEAGVISKSAFLNAAAERLEEIAKNYRRHKIASAVPSIIHPGRKN